MSNLTPLIAKQEKWKEESRQESAKRTQLVNDLLGSYTNLEKKALRHYKAGLPEKDVTSVWGAYQQAMKDIRENPQPKTALGKETVDFRNKLKTIGYDTFDFGTESNEEVVRTLTGARNAIQAYQNKITPYKK